MKLLLPALLLAAVTVACSSDPGQEPPDAGEPRRCVGGIILEDGTCVAKCDPSKCLPGNTCVDNKCTLECTGHSQCARYTQSCLPAKEDDSGRDIQVCTKVEPMEYGDPCPFGTGCSDVCHSTGPGDSRSYCTVACAGDEECPAGYECGRARVARPICDTGKGNNAICGQTKEACITREEIEASGGRFVEGEFCLEERRCLKRDTCASCETDVDCSWGVNLRCRELLDGKRCLPICTEDSDCESDKQCEGAFCRPKSGACTGTQFCSPCRYDADCPETMVCEILRGTERACVHPKKTGFCTSSAECPTTSTGKRGVCLAPYQGATSGYCNAPQKTGVDENGNEISYFSCY